MSEVHNLAKAARLSRLRTLLSEQKQCQGQHRTDDKRMDPH